MDVAHDRKILYFCPVLYRVYIRLAGNIIVSHTSSPSHWLKCYMCPKSILPSKLPSQVERSPTLHVKGAIGNPHVANNNASECA